ncbi:trichohyalin-like [Ananas comosus]|uniref:Trichohyalin-like n=1 Tax=Ananas comosus TaxID=4615 RepID=A0A6P5GFH4_ANACO|nr:trichohyalin-like [Ananas comosus]
MAIEAKIIDDEEEESEHIIEEPDITITPSPQEKPIASKASDLKEEEEEEEEEEDEEEKATKEKVQDQENLDELGSKKSSETPEGEPDRKTKPERREMAIEAQPGDKEEEKTRFIIEEPDFIRTPPPLEEPVAPKAFELKEEEEKAIEEKVPEQKNLDELEPNKGPEALEGELDGETKLEHGEMAIEAQTGDKEEEKTGLIIEESDFTRIPPPSDEPVAPKASELKEEERKKAKEEKAPEQKDLDELEPKKGSEELEGEPDRRKTKPEHREMALEAQTCDKEQEKTEIIREEPDFTRTPPSSEEPVASKASELKEEEEKAAGEFQEEEKAAGEEVPEQKDLDKLKPKKISKALEGEPDRETEPEHEEKAIEAQTDDKEEEQTGFIREEPDFSRTPPSTKEPVASKDSELEKEEEEATEEKVPEQKNLDELEPMKISEAQEGEFDGETRAEHEEMATEAQTDSKEGEQTGLIKEEPDFTGKPPPLTEPVTSKASELKEEEEKKTAEEKAEEKKNLDELELEKGSEASEGELDREIEPEPIEMAIEAPSEHKEEEQIGIHTEEPEFTIAPPALEEPILSSASKLKEEEEKKAHRENAEVPKNLEEKIQSKAFKEEKEEKEKALEERPQEQKSPDELEAERSLEELEGEPYRETEPEPKKPAIEMQTEHKEGEKIGRIAEEPDFTIPPPPFEDLIASKVTESKEEEEEQQEEAPTKETPYSPPISPILMAKPELNQELLDTTDSRKEQDREVEVPGRALETFEPTESPKQEEDRHGFGEEDAKEAKNVEEIAYDPAPKTLTRTVTPEEVDSDRRGDGEHEVRETDTRALHEDDREIASDVDAREESSIDEEEEGERSDRDREESRGEMETTEEEKENNKNGMNRRREEKAPRRRRRRRRRRGSGFKIPTAGAIATSAFILTLVALVIRLMKKRRSHALR